jgi:hypothetical protein
MGGTFNTGLDRMDVKTGKFIHYRHGDNDPNSLSFDQVRVSMKTRKVYCGWDVDLRFSATKMLIRREA